MDTQSKESLLQYIVRNGSCEKSRIYPIHLLHKHLKLSSCKICSKEEKPYQYLPAG